MSRLTILIDGHKAKTLEIGCHPCKRSIEDENDIFTEKISVSLLLFLAVLLVTASAFLVAYSAVLVIYKQQFLLEFLKTLVFASPLTVLGSAMLYYLFLRKRVKAHENSFPLGLALPQLVSCENCGATLYEGSEPISPYKVIKSCNGKCPECGEELS
ncbi:MAG: hypothetical protein PVF15_02620 [Candidatus Bathyarchaeota archaeon]|jgi:hypothetical protein